MNYVFLITACILPAIVSAILKSAPVSARLERMTNAKRHFTIGAIFGIVAIIATETGSNVGDAILNVRDAAPLCAGLLFSAPAGIIAGLIGGIERYMAPLWGGGVYTRLACTLGTIFAGLIGATLRKTMFTEREPKWMYAMAVGLITEVLHMLLIFLTHMSDIRFAFTFVERVALPMIALNAIATALAARVMAPEGLRPQKKQRGREKLAQGFQRWLLVCVLIAFSVTCAFSFALETSIARSNANELLELNLEDVNNDIQAASDRNLLQIARRLAAYLNGSDSVSPASLAASYQVSEVSIVDENGVIVDSSVPEFIGFEMKSGAQSAEFLCLLKDTDEYVQSYREIAAMPGVYRKYAGVKLASGGFVQVGYDASRFHSDIRSQVRIAASNRRIGTDGAVIVCDTSGAVVSGTEALNGETIAELADVGTHRQKTVFTATLGGVEAYCMYVYTEGYYIVAMLPVAEAMMSRNISAYVTAFIEVLIFAALFANIYFLIKRMIVDNIDKINASLSEITGGNLDVVVDVRANAEFDELSTDINSTVDKLKGYIAEAAARIDRELDFARTIQKSALPSVFPPYPQRTDFDIYADMDPAREVGGDFYDFYLLDNNRLAFMIADVSGKGIPAAMFMMTSKTMIKSLAETGAWVEEVLTRANHKLCQNNDAEMFVTVWLGVLDLRTGELHYSNAGHNPPALRHAGGQFEFLSGRPNFVLAGMDGLKYRRGTLTLQPGDEIFLYTDGVTEAEDASGAMFGDAALLSALNASQAQNMAGLCMDVKRSVDGFVNGAAQFDDMTMLAVKLNYTEGDDFISVKAESASSDYIMSFLDSQAEKLGLPARLNSRLHVAADEIFSNIARHSHASHARVELHMAEGELTMIFTDDGTQYDPTAAEEPDVHASADDREPGGLGIFMVKKMTRDMRYEHSDGLNRLTLVFNAQSTGK